MEETSSSDVVSEYANESSHNEFFKHMPAHFAEKLYARTKEDLLDITNTYDHIVDIYDIYDNRLRLERNTYNPKNKDDRDMSQGAIKLGNALVIESHTWAKIDGIMDIDLTRLIILLICNWVRKNDNKGSAKVKRLYTSLFFSVLINIEYCTKNNSDDKEMEKIFQAMCAVVHEYLHKMPSAQKMVFSNEFRHVLRHGATYGFSKLIKFDRKIKNSKIECEDIYLESKKLDEVINAQLHSLLRSCDQERIRTVSPNSAKLLKDIVGTIYHSTDTACCKVFTTDYKKQYHLFVVGSIRQNTHIYNSDIDLVVVLSEDFRNELLKAKTSARFRSNGSRPNPFPPFEKLKAPGVKCRGTKTFASAYDTNAEICIEACYNLAEQLSENEEFGHIECITSNAPTVRCRYSSRKCCNVRVDISFDVSTLKNTMLVAEYAKKHSLCSKVMRIVKLWAVSNQIADAFQGYLSGFQWLLLVVFYLQKCFYLKIVTGNTVSHETLHVDAGKFSDMNLPFNPSQIAETQCIQCDSVEQELAHRRINAYEYVKRVCDSCTEQGYDEVGVSKSLVWQNSNEGYNADYAQPWDDVMLTDVVRGFFNFYCCDFNFFSTIINITEPNDQIFKSAYKMNSENAKFMIRDPFNPTRRISPRSMRHQDKISRCMIDTLRCLSKLDDEIDIISALKVYKFEEEALKHSKMCANTSAIAHNKDPNVMSIARRVMHLRNQNIGYANTSPMDMI